VTDRDPPSNACGAAPGIASDRAAPQPRRCAIDRARRRLVGAALAAPLAACSPEAPRGGARAQITFKHAKLFGDPGAFRRLLDGFERLHPGVALRDETLPSASDAQFQFYAINLQGGSTAFDVFAVDVIWVAAFAQAGWLRDVTPLLPPAGPAGFFPGPTRAVTFDGRAWAIPWFVDAGLLYYRRDLLDAQGLAPPQTWRELVRGAQATMRREPGIAGYAWQAKQYEGLVCNVLEFLWSNGGAVLDAGRVVLDSDANRDALAFAADLIHRYHVSPASVTTATEESSRQLFGQGRAVFMRNWPYAWRLFEDAGSRVQGRVGVTTLPHFDGGRTSATLGGWQLAINARSRQPVLAEALVRYLTSADVQRALALAYGFQPSRVALYDDAELRARQPFLGLLAHVFGTARPRPVTPRYVRMSQVMQSEFSAAIAGVRTPAAALAAGQRELEQIVADAPPARD
jgi:multiple sugar transport system substrate-binding protein